MKKNLDLLQSQKEITLPYNYKPRDYQKRVLQKLDSNIKRVVLSWHRRCGKDVTIINWCIKKLVQETSTCFYVMPTYAQAKKVIWDAITNDGKRMLDYIPKELIAQQNQQEMKIRFTNGSLFQLIGSDNIDAIMGTNPHIVVFSEFALQSPDAWDFIRPILRVNGGTAIFISTPRGRNHFYDIYRMAETRPDWFVELLTYKDTGVLTDEEIDKERQEGMSEELIQQEYMCSFDRGVDGAFYAALITKMRAEDRITDLIYDPYKPVYTSWDLGWDDTTCVLFFQLEEDKIKIIDCEERNNTTLLKWKQILDERGYRYAQHLFPHDVRHVDGLSTGLTREELLEDLQIPVTVVPRSYVPDGIEAVKAILTSKVWIDEKKCLLAIKAFENYHREYDEKKKIYKDKPCHNWASHFSDSLRYLAEGKRLLSGINDLTEDAKAVHNYYDY